MYIETCALQKQYKRPEYIHYIHATNVPCSVCVRGHYSYVSCPVVSVYLLAETLVELFEQHFHARVTLRYFSNRRHVAVSSAEGHETIGIDGVDVTSGWGEQADDVIDDIRPTVRAKFPRLHTHTRTHARTRVNNIRL